MTISPIGVAWSKTKPNSASRLPGSKALAPRERELLAGGEQQLDADRGARARQAPRRREDGGDGGLVVGAEDRLVGVAEHAVLLLDLDRAGERDGVEVGAEQDRPRAGRALDAGEQVAAVGAGVGRRVVLLDLQAEALQLGAYGVGDLARSLRDGLSISHRRTKSASSRSRSAEEALWRERTVSGRRLPRTEPYRRGSGCQSAIRARRLSSSAGDVVG